MKNIILALFSMCLLAAGTPAVAWHDHDYPPTFRDYPDRYRDYRPMRERSVYGSRTNVRIERGTYDGGYLLRVYTRGMNPKDIEVTAERGRIRLRSEMSRQRAWQDESRRSRVAGYSAFTRSIPLPRDADAGKLEISATEDVLEIRIPRR